jgi:hypothetical protein
VRRWPRMWASAPAVVILSAATVLGGCGSVVVTARNSISPVLVGGPGAVDGPPRDMVRVGSMEIFALSDMSAGSTGDYTYSDTFRSAVTAVDWDVLLATKAKPHVVVICPFACRGFVFNGLVAAWARAICDASGVVTAPKKKRRRPRISDEDRHVDPEAGGAPEPAGEPTSAVPP